MKMIKYLSIVALLLSFGCSDTEDNTPKNNLNGQIQGISFEAKTATFKINSNEKLEFTIYSESSSNMDPCTIIPSGVRIYFTSDDITNRQDLYLDLDNFEGFTINIFNPDNAKTIIVSEGYFEILSNANGIIEAKLDIKTDDENFAIGNFIANLCL